MHSPFYTPLPRVQNPGAMFSKVLASVAISGRDAEGVFHDELDDSACRAAEPKVNVGLASRLVVGHGSPYNLTRLAKSGVALHSSLGR